MQSLWGEAMFFAVLGNLCEGDAGFFVAIFAVDTKRIEEYLLENDFQYHKRSRAPVL